jgi:hypothetical protein
VLADFDRDGNIDVAVTDTEERVELFAGHGDATFSAPTFIEVPGASSAAAGDVDGDGIVDLLVGASAQLAYYKGRGDGSFSAKGTFQGPFMGFEGPNYPERMALADLDGDGRLDLIAPDWGSWYTYLFIGDTLVASSFE